MGPDRKRLYIHPGALEHHSEPLHALINNGQMRESNEKVAVLEDIDVETFSLFAEYCYTGNYRAEPRLKVTSEALQQGQPTSVAQPGTTVAAAYCIHQGCTYCSSLCQHCAYVSGHKVICLDCGKEKPRPTGGQMPTNAALPILWDSFIAWKFDALNVTHERLRDHLENQIPPDEISAKVSQHAKLYVMADRYLVLPLKKLTLHKLHRDLLEYTVWSGSDVYEIAELLRVTYDNTSQGSELRKLVITYAAARSQTLIKAEAFRSFLGEGGEAVTDFTCKVSGKLT